MDPDPQNRFHSRAEHLRRYSKSYHTKYNSRRNNNHSTYSSYGDAITDLVNDWQKPRYALPSLKYLNPLKIALVQTYAVMVFGILGHASYQVWYGYISGEGLDISSGQFIAPAAMFLVAALGAAAQLRRVTLRWALRRQAKLETIIHEHEISLSPVEAGIMIDAYSSSNEIFAIMTSLVSKGYLDDRLSDGLPGLRLLHSDHQLTSDEAIFLERIFETSSEISEIQANSVLQAAELEMHEAVYNRLIASGDVLLLSAWGKIQYFALRAISIVGFVLGFWLFTLLFKENSYRILYPRYPVELWQLGFIVILLLILVLVPLQAYFTKVFSKKGMEKYRQAAGLYMYIETVLKGRFHNDTLSQSEVDYYLPYAQSFGLED